MGAGSHRPDKTPVWWGTRIVALPFRLELRTLYPPVMVREPLGILGE